MPAACKGGKAVTAGQFCSNLQGVFVRLTSSVAEENGREIEFSVAVGKAAKGFGCCVAHRHFRGGAVKKQFVRLARDCGRNLPVRMSSSADAMPAVEIKKTSPTDVKNDVAFPAHEGKWKGRVSRKQCVRHGIDQSRQGALLAE